MYMYTPGVVTLSVGTCLYE